MTIIIIVIAAYFIGKAWQASNQKRQKRIAAIEREQARQAKEQNKIRKEQARQAELLRKHEEQISKLEYKMAEAKAVIESERDRIGKLYGLLDIAEAEHYAAVPGSKADEKAQRKIITLENQIERAEAKIRKAQFEHAQAQQKLSA